MNKKEYFEWLDEEFTLVDNVLITFNIYYNPEHIEYHNNYHLGLYDWCQNYLKDHKHLLTEEHTPDRFKTIAKQQVELASKINK